MSHVRKFHHLTLGTLLPHKNVPYAIYRHQIDGDHNLNVHDHEFVELVVITGGKGIQLTPYGNIPIQTGALFVLQPGVWHGYIDCEELLVNVCCINSQLFDSELAWLRDNAPVRHVLWDNAITAYQVRSPVHHLSASQLNRCSRGFYKLQEIERLYSPQARVQQIGVLTSFLAEIADCAAASSTLPLADRKLTELPPVVEQTLMLFSENMARDWSITALSSQFGLSTSYYIRLFNREMGESPLSYLSRIRALRASQMLMCTDTAIHQIGMDVGWNEPGYFSRRFRHYFGLSPRGYRQKYRDFQQP
jgi:AraC family L-rhamnose operon transcriptional activator RhaR